MAHNSRIKDKLGYCIDCADGVLKPVIAGRCKAYHYLRRIRLKSNMKKNGQLNMLVNRHNQTKRQLDEEKSKKKIEIDRWYAEIANEIKKNPRCTECRSPISKADYHNATAHIFPKGIFKSVQTHKFNYLILGVRCGCHNRSHRLDTFSKMKVWDEAVRRFRLFENEITEHHKYLSTFKQYITND